MPTNFRPGVLPDDEPRRAYGQEVGRAFDEFIQGRETIQAGERAEAREGREAESHDFAMDVDRFRFGREREDEGFYPASEYDRTGAGTDQEGPGRPVQGAPGVRYPDVQGDAARFDPGRDPFEEEGIGIAGEFDRFREAGPQAMEKPVLLPGQFNPAVGFSPTAVFMPEARPVQQAPPGGGLPAPPGGRREVIGGQEYVQDPTRTAEAEERARAEQAFEEEVDRLIRAGVPEHQAEAVAEQGLAGSFVRPEDDAGVRRYTAAELRSAGVPEGAIPAALRNPELAERLIQEAHRRFSPRGDQRQEGPIDFDSALEIINEEYGEYDEEGYLVGYRLPPQQRFRLAEDLASGELSPQDLPSIEEAVEAAPPEEDEEGQRWWESIMDSFRGTEGASAQEPGLSYDNLPPESQERVDAAVTTIQNEFPDADEPLLRQRLQETGYSAGEIDIILRSR